MSAWSDTRREGVLPGYVHLTAGLAFIAIALVGTLGLVWAGLSPSRRPEAPLAASPVVWEAPTPDPVLATLTSMHVSTETPIPTATFVPWPTMTPWATCPAANTGPDVIECFRVRATSTVPVNVPVAPTPMPLPDCAFVDRGRCQMSPGTPVSASAPGALTLLRDRRRFRGTEAEPPPRS